MRFFVFVVWVVKPDLFGIRLFLLHNGRLGLFLFFWDMYGASRFDGRFFFFFVFYTDTMTDCTFGKVECQFCGRCVFWRSGAWKPGRRNGGDYTGIPERGFSFCCIRSWSAMISILFSSSQISYIQLFPFQDLNIFTSYHLPGMHVCALHQCWTRTETTTNDVSTRVSWQLQL